MKTIKITITENHWLAKVIKDMQARQLEFKHKVKAKYYTKKEKE